ncbi:4946_t:CDS:1, partial [Racocetra persica]
TVNNWDSLVEEEKEMVLELNEDYSYEELTEYNLDDNLAITF